MQNLTLPNAKLIDLSLMTLCKVFEHGENLKTKSQGYNPFVMRIVQNNAAGIIEALQFHSDENILAKVNWMLDKVLKNGPFQDYKEGLPGEIDLLGTIEYAGNI